MSLDRDQFVLIAKLGLVMTLFTAGPGVFIRFRVEQPEYDPLLGLAIGLAGGRPLRN